MSLLVLMGAMTSLLLPQNNPYPSELLGEFVQISAGSFMMGAPQNEAGRMNNESFHRVEIPAGFQMMKTEVTQKMWVAVMGENPSYFKGDNLPVEKVSWNDVQLFMDRLNHQNHGYRYRLPTEEEWEYAARAGTQTAYSFGENDALLPEYGWFSWNSENKTHEVRQRNPNPWGLYDMHGNVWEWVCDLYSPDYSKALSQKGANGGAFGSGAIRVIRGGGWDNAAGDLRSASRYGDGSDDPSRYVGFRLVRTKN